MPLGMRPLSTGQVLDRSFQIYRKNFGLFAGISAVPQLCLLFFQLAILSLAFMNSSAQVAIGAVVLGLATLVIAIAASAMATAATTFAVSDIYLEKPTTISACFKRVKGKILKVIFVSMEYGIRVGLGMLLLLIPGLYFLGKWGLAIPVAVLETPDTGKTFPRAAELSKDSIGRVLVVYFLTWVLVFSISMGAGILLVMIAPSMARTAGTTASQAVQYVMSALVNIVITPVMSIALTVLYYDQRVRKEAFDIQTLLALVSGKTAPPNGFAATAGK